MTVTELPLTPDELDGIDRPEFEAKRHRYTLGGKHIEGVTTILGVLDKPALPWWGMQIGVRGVLTLAERGVIFPPIECESWDTTWFVADEEHPAFKRAFAGDHAAIAPGPDDVLDDAQVVRLLVGEKLTVNHVKDEAGKRGSVAHDAAEQYVKYGTAPNLATIDPAAKPYVQSAAGFFVEIEPDPIGAELVVWSPKDWYAGTFDLLAWVDGKLTLLDFKTSKRAYDTHFLQLCAYEAARRELGLRPAESVAVVHISGEGRFSRDEHYFAIEGDEIDATIADWRDVRQVHRAMQNRKVRLKELHRRMDPPKKKGAR